MSQLLNFHIDFFYLKVLCLAITNTAETEYTLLINFVNPLFFNNNNFNN